MAVADGRAFIGDYAGNLYALDVPSGALLWQRDLGDTIGASAVVFDGRVYVMVEFGRRRAQWDGRLYALCAQTGLIVWQSTPTFGGQPHSSPAIDAERRLVCGGANSGVCRCYRIPPHGREAAAGGPATDGAEPEVVHELLWHFKAPLMNTTFDGGGRDPHEASIKGPITIWRGLVIFGTVDRCVYALDLQSGAIRLRVDVAAPVYSAVAVDDALGLAYVGDMERTFYAIDLRLGNIRWRSDVGGKVQGGPMVLRNAVLVGSADGTLYSFNKASGTEIWRSTFDGFPITSTPWITPRGEIVVVTNMREASSREDSNGEVKVKRAHPGSLYVIA